MVIKSFSEKLEVQLAYPIANDQFLPNPFQFMTHQSS